MDKLTFMKRAFLWTVIICAVVLLIIGLCFGKVIEGNIWEEIAKWVVMWAVITGILEVFTYTIGQMIYDFHVRPKVEKEKEDKKK